MMNPSFLSLDAKASITGILPEISQMIINREKGSTCIV